MNKKTRFISVLTKVRGYPTLFSALRLSALIGLTLSALLVAQGEERAWTGLGADALWLTTANWSTDLPSAADTALFSGSGNGKTTVTLGGAVTSAGILFSADAAPYIIGAPGETLTLNGGSITLAAKAVNDQRIAANLLLNNNLELYNYEPSHTLYIDQLSVNANRNLYIRGVGPVTFNKLQRPPANEQSDANWIRLETRLNAPITCTDRLTIGALWNYDYPLNLNLAPHTTNIFCRNDWGFAIDRGGAINGGDGTRLILRQSDPLLPGRYAVQNGTVTINVQLSAPGGLTCVAGWENGTLVLAKSDNDIPGPFTIDRGNCVQVAYLAGVGVAQPLGSGGAFNFINPLSGSNPARLRVTGNAPSTSNKSFTIDKDRAVIENAGSALLTLTGSISGNGTVVFDGNGPLAFTGIRSGSGGLTKSGHNTLTLSGANNYSGATVVNSGTLIVAAGGVLGANTLTLASGSTLNLNPAATANFSLALPATVIDTSACLAIAAPVSGTSTVTIPTLTLTTDNSTLSVTAPDAGGSNRIFISDLADGPVAWITLNGSPAAYSAASGLAPYTPASVTHIATLGPGAIVPDDPTGAAIIDLQGSAGAVTLASNLTSLALLSQEHATDALIDFGGGILAADMIRQVPGAGGLTLQSGTLTANGANPNAALAGLGTVTLVPLSDDASTGISPAKSYTHLLDFGNQALASINHVTFTKVNTAAGSVGGYGWSGFPTALFNNEHSWTNNIPPATGAGLRALLYDMVYSGNNYTIQLSGLTPGAAYEFCLYLRAWDNPPTTIERRARFDFLTDVSAAPVASTTFDMNHNDPTAMVVRYIAATSVLTLKTYCAATTSNPYPGFYGLTNEELAAAPALLDTGRAALAISASGTAPVVVSAAIADNGRTTALVQEGQGVLSLAGQVSHTGATILNGGTLDLAPAAGITQMFAAPIVGGSTVIKRGAGSTLFLGANGYSGLTIISNGILAVAHSDALGGAAAGTVVEQGGALALGAAQFNALTISEPITLSGAGPDGLGALRNDSLSPQYNAFRNLALAGPATIGGTAALPGLPYTAASSVAGRFDIRNGTLDLGGHRLTKAGPSAFFVTSTAISGVTQSAAIDITGGVFGLEASTDLQGSAANTLTVGGGTSFDLYRVANPLLWSLVFENQAHLTARNNNTADQNILSGPVTLNGTLILDGGYHDTFSGVLSGAGGLRKTEGFTHLTGIQNTYAGATEVTGGTLLALAASSVPAADFSRVSVSGSGTFVVRPDGAAAGQLGWSNSEINALINAGVFKARSTTLGFESMYDDYAFSGLLPIAGLAQFGPKTVTIESSTAALGPVTVYNGELGFATGSHALDTYSVTVGAEPLNSALATLRLSGSASLLPSDLGYRRSGPLVAVGTADTSRGIICLEDNASISGRLYLGSGGGNAEGAVYQSGGTFVNTGGSANDGRLGINGHGYYEISDGLLVNKGYTQFGVNYNNVGILRQSGGSVIFNSGATPAEGMVADCYGGSLAVRAGLGLFHLSGGTLTTGTAKFSLGEWDGVNNYNDGTGILTLEGDASASVGYCELANRNGTVTSIVNLNGGALATRFIQKGGNNNSGNSRAFVNFNGGILRLTESGSAIRTAANNSPAGLAVHDGGALIEVDPSVNATLDLPLDPLAGQGLAFVGINSRGAGYIAPPFVNITGGGGYGASAVAAIDRLTGQLTEIRVTSPGFGYTSSPAVTLVGGGYTSAASVRDIRIGVNTSSGGLTKLGDGALVLSKANTFRGPITLTGGILTAKVPEAIPQGADLNLNGGVLDLGGRSLTNASVTLSSSAVLLNGSVVTAALVKEGAGTADLAAGTTLAALDTDADYGTPGLYEGRLENQVGIRSNRVDPNPGTAVQLTTRAVNGAIVGSGGTINGCWWPDNTCYVYSGYIWNRAATNVVWTFGENFDDNVYLAIDGNAILDNDGAGTPTYRNVTLIPGPHPFELRCGQGGGNVGANWVRTDNYRIGFGVDFQGRAQNNANYYQPLVDPGDGSLFTIDLPLSYTEAELAPAPELPETPAEIAQNIGALADGYALVYASDVPAQGGIINGNATGVRYFVDNSRSNSNDFDRVAYYLELVHPTYGNQWIWVSFDAVTRDRTLIGYPYHDSSAGAGYCANVFQRRVDNMDVLSNVASINDYVGCATGNIEFWPNNYSQADALGLGALSDSNNSGYDFGDSKSDGAPSVAGHGSFQIHNWGDKTTLFSMCNWGNNNYTISLGIGNQPGSGTGIAPDWTFNNNGAQYTSRRLYVLTRDIVRAPKVPTATVVEGTLRIPAPGVIYPLPENILSKVGAAANGYDTVYVSAVPAVANTIVSGTAYSIDNSSATTPFDRVAYYLELEHPTYGSQWVWVSFDAHTTERTKLGYPSQSNNRFMWQQRVDNMDVRSNVSGVNSTTGSATGNIEIWPSNYSPVTIPANGLDGSGSLFDYDDSGASTAAGHGCFQIHNWGDKVTLLALSHLGNNGNVLGIGIGNNPQLTNNDPDYTFSYNAAQYTLRNLYVFVRPTAGGVGNTLAGVDLTVNAGATLDLSGAPQSIRSISGAGTVFNGALTSATILSPAGDGAVGTLSLANVTLAPGVLYRADLGDRLDATGMLDLAGMVVQINNPEALDRSQAYTLIRTTDGLTGLPTLASALPRSWKLLLRGKELRLVSDTGTFLILR